MNDQHIDQNSTGASSTTTGSIPSRYGALEIQPSLFSENTFSGSYFSIRVRITNPFDVPVIIKKVSPIYPFDLYDLRGRRDWEEEREKGIKERSPNVIKKIQDLSAQIIFFDPVKLTSDKEEKQWDNQSRLQPGDSTSRVITLRTRKWLLFTPSTQSVDILVDYEVNGTKRFQVISYNFFIQGAINNVCFGAVIGSLLGVVVKNQKLLNFSQEELLTGITHLFPEFFSAIITSFFVVVAFARKGGAQPVITVQDFWGGLLIGFLTGQGISLINFGG